MVGFLIGSILGYAIAFLRFRSRVTFYKYLVEQRLAAVKQGLLGSKPSPRE